MRFSILPLIFSTTGQVTAQFFVLYGRDTVISRIDPIISPGSIGAHSHDFMGAGNVDQNSDYDSLLKASCSSLGRANGNPINEDRSIYWHPSLYVKAKAGGYIRVPTNGNQIYYINSGTGQMREPFEFPEGFRMTAGSKLARAAQAHSPTNYDNVTQWTCYQPSSYNQGNSGGFPDGVTSCPSYPFLRGLIHFPHCWNGNDFDINDPSAHMSQAQYDVVNGPCPATHPIKLPHILMESDFDLTSIVGQFVENSFVLSNGDPTGYGYHADFYNGWKTNVLHNLLNGSASCSTHDVGDCSGVTFDTSRNWAQCTTTNNYSENLDGPLSALPGCNPISTVDPAVQCAVCSAGVVGGTCFPSTTAGAATTTKPSTTMKTMTSSMTTTRAASSTDTGDGDEWECDD